MTDGQQQVPQQGNWQSAQQPQPMQQPVQQPQKPMQQQPQPMQQQPVQQPQQPMQPQPVQQQPVQQPQQPMQQQPASQQPMQQQAMQQPVIQIVTDKNRSGKKARRAGGTVIRVIIWIVVVVAVIVAALFISAWIAGFRNADGWPILFNENGSTGMIDWIRNAI